MSENASENGSAGEPRYPYVLIDVEGAMSDEASATLFELGALGVEERDATTLKKSAKANGVTLVASFGSHDDARAAIAELPEEWAPRLEEVVGDAWRDEWKKYFHPFAICDGIVIRPPWEPYEPKAGERVLELEPGRAFGTGLHETTWLVSQALATRKNKLAGASVLDVGCGSGVLSLIALELGAKDARAIDIDADAVAVTIENAERNAMGARVTADTTDVSRINARYPIVLANIEARVLIPLAGAIASRVAPGGLLVLSGILAPQEADVRAAYAGLAHDETIAKGEWIAIVLSAPARAAGS